MIADTSVWIDWLRGDESPPANLLQAELDAGHPVYALPVIIQEILQGARSPGHYHALDRELSRLRVDVSLDGLKVARAAAHVYARCRWAAFTPRHTNDCCGLMEYRAMDIGARIESADVDGRPPDLDQSEVARWEGASVAYCFIGHRSKYSIRPLSLSSSFC